MWIGVWNWINVEIVGGSVDGLDDVNWMELR
ncbi:hypothetical protein LINPERHAP1_LOCUS12862 [Linum perenne]